MNDIRYQIGRGSDNYTDQRDVVFMAKGMLEYVDKVEKEVKTHGINQE